MPRHVEISRRVSYPRRGANTLGLVTDLYQHKALDDTCHINMGGLVDGVPKTIAIKGILEEFSKHRREVGRRRTQFDLTRAQEREHILLGLKKALDHIDEVIKTIRASKDVAEAEVNLIKKFKFSVLQAKAILEMRPSRLANLERTKIEDELPEVQAVIEELPAPVKAD